MAVIGDQEALQQLLPDGLIIENRLPSGAFGFVLRVRDERSSFPSSGRLSIRVIPKPVGSKWEEHLKNRIEVLAGCFVPHLSPLVEAGQLKNEDWYLAHPLHYESLATKLKRESGQRTGWVECLAEQLLTGLAELHRRGITHGNIRPENIFLDAPSDRPEEIVVHLGDATTGGIASWSQGEFVGTGNGHYRPTGSDGSVTDTTPTSDLYAVGVLLAELLIGTEGVATAKSKADEHKTSLYQGLREYKEFKSASARLRSLIQSLLVPANSQGLRDANDALSLLRRPSRWPSAGWGLAALTTLLLIIVTMLWSSDFHRLENLRRQLESEFSSTKQLLVDTQQSVSELKKELKRANDRIHELEIINPPPPPPADAAEAVWKGMAKLVRHDPNALISAISKEPDQKTKDKLLKWAKDLQKPVADATGWEYADPQGKLEPLLLEAIATPWNQERLTAVDERMKALHSARDWWRGQVENENQTPDGIYKALATRKGDEQEILKGWIGAFSQRTEWNMRLKKGVIIGEAGEDPPEGHREKEIGLFRLITLYKNGEQQGDSKEFDWANAFKHEFRPDDVFVFTWAPGDSLGVLMERGAYGGDWLKYMGSRYVDLVEEEFKGPYAIQRMHWKSHITGTPKSGVDLEFEVVDCPGPPLPKPPTPQ